MLIRVHGRPLPFRCWHRWYTEVTDFCDAMKAGRIASVDPSAVLEVGVCTQHYATTYEPSFVLALPETLLKRSAWLHEWMDSHVGCSPYASKPGAAMKQTLPVVVLPFPQKSVPFSLDLIENTIRDPLQLNEFAWYDAMENDCLRATALVDAEGKTVSAQF